jgi:hypothetical protein
VVRQSKKDADPEDEGIVIFKISVNIYSHAPVPADAVSTVSVILGSLQPEKQLEN